MRAIGSCAVRWAKTQLAVFKTASARAWNPSRLPESALKSGLENRDKSSFTFEYYGDARGPNASSQGTEALSASLVRISVRMSAAIVAISAATPPVVVATLSCPRRADVGSRPNERICALLGEAPSQRMVARLDLRRRASWCSFLLLTHAGRMHAGQGESEMRATFRVV